MMVCIWGEKLRKKDNFQFLRNVCIAYTYILKTFYN